MHDGANTSLVRSYFGEELQLALVTGGDGSFCGFITHDSPIEKSGTILNGSSYGLTCSFRDVGYSIRKGRVVFDGEWVDAILGESLKFYNSYGDVAYNSYNWKGQISFGGYLDGDDNTMTPSPYAKRASGLLKIRLRKDGKEFHVNVNTVIFTPSPEYSL